MYRRSTKQRSRGDWRRFLRSRSIAGILIIGIIIIGISLTKEIIRKVQIQAQIRTLEEDIAVLEQHNQELNELMAYLNSSSFQEKEAKVKLNLTAPGETVVVLPEGDTATDTATTVAVAAVTPSSNFQKWINYFFH